MKTSSTRVKVEDISLQVILNSDLRNLFARAFTIMFLEPFVNENRRANQKSGKSTEA
jgi:hypothetical protein